MFALSGIDLRQLGKADGHATVLTAVTLGLLHRNLVGTLSFGIVSLLNRLLTGTPCILSTGGGAFLSEVNRGLIAASGVSVWLRADLDLLWQRVRHKTTRPLLRTPNPRATLQSLYEARVPYYALADLVVDSAPDISVEAMAQRVLETLRDHDDVLERK